MFYCLCTAETEEEFVTRLVTPCPQISFGKSSSFLPAFVREFYVAIFCYITIYVHPCHVPWVFEPSIIFTVPHYAKV
jgi:hypothetical protein